MAHLTPELLRVLLRYEPGTGRLFWRERPPCMFSSSGNGQEANCSSWNTRNAGNEALTARNKWGYKHGSILGDTLKAHRVIWAMVHGEWPEFDVDHINGVRDDNRFSNIRSVSRSDNLKNQKINTRNTSGVMGVRWCSHANKWLSRIHHNGHNISLGPSNCITAAKISRKLAEIKYGYHSNHGRSA